MPSRDDPRDNELRSLRAKPPRPSPHAPNFNEEPASGSLGATLPASKRILGDWIERASVETGLAQRDYQEALARGLIEPTYRLTVDLLRALDAHQGRLAAGAHSADRLRSGEAARVPEWLLSADREAQEGLAQWYAVRGLPTPETREDPGDPDPSEAVIDFPRNEPHNPRERLVEWLKCRRDVVYFVDNYGHLAHKVRGVIPFRLWKWQAWLLHQWHANPLSIALKARQLGASELAAAYSAWTVLFFDTKNVLMLSKREDDAIALLSRAVLALDFLPDWLRPGSQTGVAACVLGRRNTTVFEIVHIDADGRAHPSTIVSLPATQGAGRSLTAALVILDEWAYQMWATQIWTSIKPTADGGGRIIGLSTANGVGNLFHQLWVYATDSIGAAGDANSAQDVPSSEIVADDRARRFGRFFAAFLSWRRHPERDDVWYAGEAREKARINQSHLLHQEYPSEPLQAFVQSGRNVFDASYLERHQQRITAEMRERRAQGLPAWQAVDGLTVYDPPQDAIIEDRTGKLLEARHRYLLSADVAEGLVGGDYDCAIVVDRETGLEVACLYGHWPPDEYARRLDKLGHLYFDALLAVERNNHGHAVLLALQNIHRYPSLYHYSDPAIPGRAADRRAGWPTTPTTKPLAVDKLRELLAGDMLFPRTLTFLNEALVYAYLENGSMSAPEGYHDDTVAAFWIAAFLLTRPELSETVLAFVRGRAERVHERLVSAQHSQYAQHGLPPGAQVERLRGPGAPLQGAVNPVAPTTAAALARQRLASLLNPNAPTTPSVPTTVDASPPDTPKE